MEPSVAEKIYDSPFWLTFFNIYPGHSEYKFLYYAQNSRIAMEKRYSETLTEFQAFGIALPIFDVIAGDALAAKKELLDATGFSEESEWGQFLIQLNPYQMLGTKNEEDLLIHYLRYFSHIAFAHRDESALLTEQARNDPVAQNFVVDRGRRVAYGRAVFYALVHSFDQRKVKTETEEERKDFDDAIYLSDQLLEFNKEWWSVEYRKDVKQIDSIGTVFDVLLVGLSYELYTSWRSKFLQLMMKSSGIILPDQVWEQFEGERSVSPSYSRAAQITIQTGWPEVYENRSVRLNLFDWENNRKKSAIEFAFPLLQKNLETMENFRKERFKDFNIYYIYGLASTIETYAAISTVDDLFFERYDTEVKKEIDGLSGPGLPSALWGAQKYDSYKYGDYHPWRLDISFAPTKPVRKKKWFGREFSTSLISKGDYEKFDEFLQSYSKKMQKNTPGLSPTIAYLNDLSNVVNQNRVKRILSQRSNDDNFFVFIANDTGPLRTITNLYVLYKKEGQPGEWIFNATNLYSKNKPMAPMAMGTVFSSDTLLNIFKFQQLGSIVSDEDSQTFRTYISKNNITPDRILVHVMWLIDTIVRGWSFIYAINLTTWFGLKDFIENAYYKNEIDPLIPQ